MTMLSIRIAALAIPIAFIAIVRAEVRTIRTEGQAAWEQVYSVLVHPRCLNCHTATNYPQQGDDRHRHVPSVLRGPEDKGVAGLNCATCHQDVNADVAGVPGAPGWHLAPLSMRWQDANDRAMSSAAVCRALIDPAKNHGLDGPGLLKHHEEEVLVRWAWHPGRHPDGTALVTTAHVRAIRRRNPPLGCRGNTMPITTYQLDINGKRRDVTVDPSTPLLWVLREELKMTGTKYGCGISICGACTVHVDGVATRSCVLPVSQVGARRIVTIEAIGTDPIGRAVQEAWVEKDVVQCGYCQSGQIMTAVALLTNNPTPTDADIEHSMGSNLCRCGTYVRIRHAIKRASTQLG
jgi:isoquinoline 1-oxidoreductase alpha subunit